MTDDGADLLAEKDAFFGHGVVRDPYPELGRLLARCPVHPGTPSEHFGTIGPESILFGDRPQCSVLSFAGAEQVFRDQERFSSSWYEPSLGATIGRTIIEMDPPEHGRHRQLIQGAFTKKEMERWEHEFVRDIVDATIDTFADRGRADLVADFAVHYPLRVLATACALPASDVDTFQGWAAVLTNVSIEPTTRHRVAAEFGDYLREVIARRREEPGRDLVSLLVTAEFRDEHDGRHRLTTEEVVAFMRLLLPAGAQTTYRTLCNVLYGLLTNTDQLDAVRADHSLIPQAVEEGLRWEPPLITFGRTAVADGDVDGVPVASGTPVNVVVGSANRDPARWADAARFDIFRVPQPHLAFGTGPHVCLGMHFARMELRVALERLLDRLPGLELAPDAGDVHIGGLGARSPARLPVCFE